MIDDKQYEGELDPDNRACGEGILKSLSGDMYEGTFCENKYHGFGKFLRSTDFVNRCHYLP